jgi:hypothetical protein
MVIIEGGGGDFILTSGGGTWDPATGINSTGGAAYQGMGEADLAGAGRNISLIFAGRSMDVEPPHTLQAYTIAGRPRGQVKRTAHTEFAGISRLPNPLGGGVDA